MSEKIFDFKKWLNKFQIWYEIEYGREDMEERGRFCHLHKIEQDKYTNYANIPVSQFVAPSGDTEFYLFLGKSPCRHEHPDLYKEVLQWFHPEMYDMYLAAWYSKGGAEFEFPELRHRYNIKFSSVSGLVLIPDPVPQAPAEQVEALMGKYVDLHEAAKGDSRNITIRQKEAEEKFLSEHNEYRKELRAQVAAQRAAQRAVLNHTVPSEMTGEVEERQKKRKRPVDGDWMTDEELERWQRKYTRYADWEGVYEFAKAGDLDAIGAARPDITIRNYANLTKIQTRNISGAVTNHLRGVWIMGSSGTGKSTLARMTTGGEHYVKLANKWWDGYRGEKYVILDDFMPVHRVLGYHLKLWADRHDTTGEVKGGAVGLAYQWIIVTSQYSIDQIWTTEQWVSGQGAIEKRDEETISALKRRFLVLRPVVKDKFGPGIDPIDHIKPQAVLLRQTLEHIAATGELPADGEVLKGLRITNDILAEDDAF